MGKLKPPVKVGDDTAAAAGGEPKKEKALVKSVVDDVVLGGTVRFRVKAQSLNARLDDPIYQKNRDIWESVTRGGCKVYALVPTAGGSTADTADGNDEVLVAQMCGTRKFGYWEDAAYGYRDRVVSIVCTEKANGENAQCSAFSYGGERYWIVGSKNVPIVLRHHAFLEDLEHYRKERYVFARKIAELLHRKLLSQGVFAYHSFGVPEEDASAPPALTAAATSTDGATSDASAGDPGLRLHDFLSASGHTLVMEAIFLDSQHLVEYAEDALHCFGLTHPGQPSEEGLTALPPAEALEALRGLGMETVRIIGTAPLYEKPEPAAAASLPAASADTAAPTSAGGGGGGVRDFSRAYTALCARIGELPNSEGAVAYGLDGAGRVAYMFKVKSHEYVIGRRARQIILGGLPEAALAARLAELARFGVPERLIPPRARHFAGLSRWLRGQMAYREVLGDLAPAAAAAAAGGERRGAFSLQQQWVTLGKAYAAHVAAAGGDAEAAAAAGGDPTAAAVTPATNGGKVVIMLQGLPLTGKSTLARGLHFLLRRCGHEPAWLNQDEVAATRGLSRREGYLRQLTEAAADPRVTHIILDKSNVDAGNVTDYLARGVSPTVTVRMRHPYDAPGSLRQLLGLCRARFFTRGAGHRTLRAPPAAGPAASSSAAGAAAAAGAGVEASASEPAASDEDEDEATGGTEVSAPPAPTKSAPAALSKSTGGAKKKKGAEGLVNIDAVLGAFAAIDGAAAVCGGVASLDSLYDDEAAGAVAGAAGLVINHSVLLPPNEALASVWAALASNGLVSEALTPLRDHEEALAAAVAHSAAYEQLLAAGDSGSAGTDDGGTSAPPPTRSWGVSFPAGERLRLLRLVPAAAVPLLDKPALPTTETAAASAPVAAATADVARRLHVLPHVHHTLQFVGGAADPAAELRWGTLVASAAAASAPDSLDRTVTVRGFAWDDSCLCAVLEPTESVNTHPHITLALHPGVQAAYSNELLGRLQEARAAGSGSEPASAHYEALEGGVRLTGRLMRNPL